MVPPNHPFVLKGFFHEIFPIHFGGWFSPYFWFNTHMGKIIPKNEGNVMFQDGVPTIVINGGRGRFNPPMNGQKLMGFPWGEISPYL